MSEQGRGDLQMVQNSRLSLSLDLKSPGVSGENRLPLWKD